MWLGLHPRVELELGELGVGSWGGLGVGGAGVGVRELGLWLVTILAGIAALVVLADLLRRAAVKTPVSKWGGVSFCTFYGYYMEAKTNIATSLHFLLLTSFFVFFFFGGGYSKENTPKLLAPRGFASPHVLEI